MHLRARMYKRNRVFDCRIDCVNFYVTRRQFIRFPCTIISFFCRNCRCGNVFIFNGVRFRTNDCAVCLKGYGIFAKVIYCIYNFIATVKRIRFPLRTIAFFCGNGRLGNGIIFYRIGQNFANLYAVCLEGYGILDCRINRVNFYVTRRQFIRFPYAVVMCFRGNCGRFDFFVFYRVGQNFANLFAVCLERYGILDCRINCINFYVTRRQFIRFPCPVVMCFRGNCGRFDFFVFYRVGQNFANLFAVCLERYGIYNRRIYCINYYMAAIQGIAFPYAKIAVLGRNSRFFNRLIICGVGQRFTNLHAVCLERYGIFDCNLFVRCFIGYVCGCRIGNFLVPTREFVHVVAIALSRRICGFFNLSPFFVFFFAKNRVVVVQELNGILRKFCGFGRARRRRRARGRSFIAAACRRNTKRRGYGQQCKQKF